MPLHWQNDPLFYDTTPTSYNDWVTANTLIPTVGLSAVVTSDFTFTNLYGMLVRKIDFVRLRSNERILARFPFLVLNEPLAAVLRENLLNLSMQVRDYFYRSVDKTILQWQTVIQRYLRKGTVPLPIIRCLFELVPTTSSLFHASPLLPFTSARGESFTFPTILSKKLAYLCGVCHGDGNLRDYWLIIADETQAHIAFLSSLLAELFGRPGKLLKAGGAWLVKLNLLWAVRLFNFLTGQAIDEPKYATLREPPLFRALGGSFRSLYWRGAFDADGSFKNQIVFCSMSKAYSKDFQFYLAKNAITSHFFRKSGGGYQVNVLAKDKMRFAKLIGSSHPKKRIDFLVLLQKTLQNLQFVGFNSNRLTIDGFFDFKYLPTVAVHGLATYFHSFTAKTSIFTKSDLRLYRNNTGITIKKLLKHLRNTNQHLMPFLAEHYSKITFRSSSSSALKLPLKPSRQLEKLATYFIPTDIGATLYQSTPELMKLRETLFGISSQEEKIANQLLGRFFRTFGLYKEFQIDIEKNLQNWKEKLLSNIE